MSNNKNDLKSAQINLDNLMNKMKDFSNNNNDDNSNSSRLDKSTKHKASNAKSPNNKGSNKKNKKASNDKPKQEPSKKRKLSESKGSDDHSKSIHNDNGYSNSLENKVDKNNKNPQTSLQAKMKKSLSGARFRWINETLYTTNSEDAHSLILNDPTIFDEYHEGFSEQTKSWPQNPVNIIAKSLKSLPKSSTLIADLGSGPGTLAKLLPQNRIFSYDLIDAENGLVVECDIAKKVPLPNNSVDIVVCCLSLMGSNWIGVINESQRILVNNGKLQIAEVKSRFTNIKEFITLVSNFGFTLAEKDESNTHFVLLAFTKTNKKGKANVENYLDQSKQILEPCLYKRR